MIQAEVVNLCRFIKALCPSQVFDTYTPDAWGLILDRYSYEDAKSAVAAIVGSPLDPGKSRYIEPGHIIAGIHRIRQARLDAHPLVTPPPGLSVREYGLWNQRVRRAIADGTYTAPADEPTADPERLAALVDAAKPKALDAENRSNEREATA